VVLGALSFVLGFAMVWHIWWLAALSGLALWGPIVARTFDDHAEHRIAAREVAAIENSRRPALAGAA
jgi:cytochrome o ubiquinol oxidase subunit 1